VNEALPSVQLILTRMSQDTHHYGPHSSLVAEAVLWRKAAEDLYLTWRYRQFLVGFAQSRRHHVLVFLDMSGCRHHRGDSLVLDQPCRLESCIINTANIACAAGKVHLASPACVRMKAALTCIKKCAFPSIFMSGSNTADSAGVLPVGLGGAV
jgi:hypothetical protein